MKSGNRAEIFSAKSAQEISDKVDAVKTLLFATMNVVEFVRILQLLILEVVFNYQTSVSQCFFAAGKNPGYECQRSVQQHETTVRHSKTKSGPKLIDEKLRVCFPAPMLLLSILDEIFWVLGLICSNDILRSRAQNLFGRVRKIARETSRKTPSETAFPDSANFVGTETAADSL